MAARAPGRAASIAVDDLTEGGTRKPPIRVAQLRKVQPTEAEEVARVMADLNDQHGKGRIEHLVVVAFNPLGGFQLQMTGHTRFSTLALAAAIVQREVIACLDGTKEAPYPPDPAA
jgi:hypothetical protein